MISRAKLRHYLSILRVIHVDSPAECAVAQNLSRRNEQRNLDPGSPCVVVQAPDDVCYLSIFGEIVTALRRVAPLRAEQYIPRALRPGEFQSFNSWVWARLVYNRWSERRWQKLYASFCDGIAVRATKSLGLWAEVRVLVRAYRLWRNLRDKESLARLTVNGVLIGDLVIDNYIRFRPKPDLLLSDWYIWVVLCQGLRDAEKAFSYFGEMKPKLFLTSYTTYVHHGVPARVAIAMGVKVISFGNYQQMCKELSAGDHLQLARHWDYRKEFDALPRSLQAELVTEADRRMRARMLGEVDSAIGYMRQSPYLSQSDDVPDVKGAVIIYLPDFFDSIHVYRWTVFHDYWEWACFTIETLQSAGIPFFVRTHPNGYADTRQIYEEIRRRYPTAPFLPQGLTTSQLVDAGIACGVSPRGTILSELGYLGVPAIAGGDHPHADFDLTPPPKTLEQYRVLLLNAAHLPRDPEKMKRSSCEFYAMHSLYREPGLTALRDKWLFVRNATLTPEITEKSGLQNLTEGLQRLQQDVAFKRHVAQWAAFLGMPAEANADAQPVLKQSYALDEVPT